MSRTTAALTDAACRLARPTGRPYKLFDGDGLYLLIQPNGRKGWRLRYVKPDGREGVDLPRQLSRDWPGRSSPEAFRCEADARRRH